MPRPTARLHALNYCMMLPGPEALFRFKVGVMTLLAVCAAAGLAATYATALLR